MFQVLLVYTDLPVLEAIRHLPLWQGFDFTLAAATNEEQEALVFMQSHPVDILLLEKGFSDSLSQKVHKTDLPFAVLTFDVSGGMLENDRLDMALTEARTEFVIRKGLKALAEEKLSQGIRGKSLSPSVQSQIFGCEKKRWGLALFLSDADLKEQLPALVEDSIILETGRGKFLTLFGEPPTGKDNPTDYLENVLSNLGENTSIVWNGYLTEPFNLQVCYCQLLRLSCYRPYFAGKSLITKTGIDNLPAMDIVQFSAEIEAVRSLATKANPSDLMERIQNLYRYNVPDLEGGDPLFYLNFQLMHLFLEIVAEGNLNSMELFNKPYIPVDEVFALPTTNEMVQWFEQAFQKAQELFRQNAIPRVRNEKVQHALRYIHLHYSSPLPLDTLASECMVHKVYLCRIFQKEVGISCHAYLQKLRLQKSVSLLLTTETPIKDIAQKVGFTSYDQFGKAFHREFAMSPHQYKEANKQNR
jgi:AraC-like DNA-binding protein